MNDWINVACIVFGVACVLLLWRNNITLIVRVWFLLKAPGQRWVYDALPGYVSMLLNPMHFGRWTKADWLAYAAAIQEAKEGV